jgi:pSer/pThr/pTyr-binding forkhead associated (FHA) protein
MASESTASSSTARSPQTRTTPVLVPQGVLLGRPDIPLDRAVTTVGASETSRLHLTSRTISKSHALLINSNGGTYVADLASRTGVLVNGKAVHDAELKTGDRVQIGKFLFRYRSPNNSAPAVRTDPPPAAVIVVGSPAVPITGRVSLIGRRENSEIPLPGDGAVSAAHAVIFQVDGKWVIRDLGSRTGTIVNGKATHQQALKFGDRIQIGASSILFQPAKAPVAEPVAEPVVEETDYDLAPADFSPGPLEVEPAIATVEPEPVTIEQSFEPEGAPSPVANVTEPAAADDTLIAAEHADLEAPSLLEETLPMEPTTDPSPAMPEPVAREESAEIPVAEIPFADDFIAETQDGSTEAPLESIETASAERTASPEILAAVEDDAPVLLSETLPIEVAVEPRTLAEEPLPVEEMQPAPEPRTEPATLETAEQQTAPVSSVEETEPVEIDEPVVDGADAVDGPAAIEPPVETAIETPVAAEVNVEEPAIAVNSAEPEQTPTSSPIAAPVTATINEPSAAVAEMPTADELPDVMFWGDPELDAVAEQVILSSPGHLAEPAAGTEAGELVVASETAAPSPSEAHSPDISDVNAEPVVAAEPSNETATDEAQPPAEPEAAELVVAGETVAPPPSEAPSLDISDANEEPVVFGEPSNETATDDSGTDLGANEPAESEAVEAISAQAPPASADAVPAIEPIAAVDSEDILVTESLPAMPVDTETVQDISLDAFAESNNADSNEANPPSTDDAAVSIETVQLPEEPVASEITLDDGGAAESSVEVETVFGDESAAAVDDFSPEGTVSITTAPAGDVQAVVNEFVPGDSEASVEFADEQATLAESTTADLPGTDELLSGVADDAPIEGLEEVAAAETPTTESADLEDLEWLDDASPMESVHGLILDDQSAQPVAEAITPVAELVEPAESLGGTEDDLDFLDFSDESGKPADIVADPEKEPETAGEAHGFLPVEEPRGRSGPSLFGFDFEGGSFLGGTPLKLNALAPASAAAVAPAVAGAVAVAKTAAVVGAAAAVFDVSTKARSGLGGMLIPQPERTKAPTPAKPGNVAAVPPRPMTPPRPTSSSVKSDSVPMSLTGLGTDKRSAWPGAPEIPPIAKADAKTAADPAHPQAPGSAAAGTKPRSLDVFSQISAPIGVEVFGGRQANPVTVKIPDSSETRALAAAEAEHPGENRGENGQAAGTASPDDVAARTAPHRRSKIPLLLLMMFVFPIALFGAVFSFVPSNAKIVGTLNFTGGNGQDSHAFGYEQVQRIVQDKDDRIRATARAILVSEKKPTGFTEDQASYRAAMSKIPPPVSWEAPGTLNFEYVSTEYPGFDFKAPRQGPDEVAAVLKAVKSEDQNLNDIQGRARAAREAATDTRVAAQTAIASLEQQEKAERALAQQGPTAARLSDLDSEAALLKQQFADAKTVRDSSAAVLDELRKRDPAKPIDMDHDPYVLDLQHQIDQLNDQIARSRSSNGASAAPTVASNAVAAGSAIVASTTQPADSDPLVAVLQQQADKLSLRLQHRRDELAADAALTPDQRAMNLQSAIENMSVKLTTLDRTEADAKEASDHATADSDAAHKQADDANVAGAKLDDLVQKQMAAESTLKQARDDETQKQAALDACITVVPGSAISVQTTEAFDPQWPTWAIASSVVVLLLGVMIYGEVKRPPVIAGVTPAAAPLVNPPLRAVPWPQPHQLEGLQSTAAKPANAEEPEQFVGI